MSKSDFTSELENGVMVKVTNIGSYEKASQATGEMKTKVRFVVEPLDATIEIPKNQVIVDVNQLKNNLQVNPERPNLKRFKNEVLEFQFYQMDEELITGKKCEKEYTLVRNVVHHESEESILLSKKAQQLADAGVTVQF